MFRISTKSMVYAGLCLALALLLPFLTGQLPSIGSAISPMHIPVLLCGFLCGAPLGAIVGAVAPLLRSVLFGMPPMFPTATAMAFELCGYGLIAGLCYKLLPKSLPNVYIALALAMLGGRIVWGVAMWSLTGGNLTFDAFLASAFVKAVPAIILHLVLIPPIVYALQRAHLIPADV